MENKRGKMYNEIRNPNPNRYNYIIEPEPMAQKKKHK